uniref:Uncharacterized protein n=1 Tax=Oryza rufipogon TaxID=4529 RepID=A0A0E0QW63_ORYRU
MSTILLKVIGCANPVENAKTLPPIENRVGVGIASFMLRSFSALVPLSPGTARAATTERHRQPLLLLPSASPLPKMVAAGLLASSLGHGGSGRCQDGGRIPSGGRRRPASTTVGTDLGLSWPDPASQLVCRRRWSLCAWRRPATHGEEVDDVSGRPRRWWPSAR